jgi:hypothetical protein
MTQSSRPTRLALAVAALMFAASTLAPARGRADMPDAASLVDYGFKGFTLGLELGLAVGYITTGPRWHSNEWKNLAIGMGIGALSGMTTGIIVAVADTTSEGTGGYYLLRDAGYGTLLGGTMGAVVGMLLWVDEGSSKDVLKGSAFGAIFGAGAGIVYGIIEASHAKPRGRYDDDDEDEAGLQLGKDLHVSAGPIGGAGQGVGVAGVVWGTADFM